MSVVVEVTLVTGEHRVLSLPSHTGSLAAALDRLHDWIETDDGSWVQKRFVVEARLRPAPGQRGASRGELQQLEHAVERMVGASEE